MARTRWLLNSLGAKVVHPGTVLRDVYMRPYAMSQNALARELGVPPRCVNEIVHGERAITARTALLLARVFGGDGMDWLERQALYDLAQAARAMGRRRGRPSRGRAPHPELARRESATKESARAEAARKFDENLWKYLKDNQIGAFAPGYGRAVVPQDDHRPEEPASAQAAGAEPMSAKPMPEEPTNEEPMSAGSSEIVHDAPRHD